MTRIPHITVIFVLFSFTAISPLADAQDRPFPAGPNFERFAQSGPPPALDLTNPFKVQPGHIIVDPAAKIPNTFAKIPNTLLMPLSARPNPCSVPLLRMAPSPRESFTMTRVPAPPTDPAMVVKPLAPSCDETGWVPVAGIAPPQNLNRR
jgi:hypothetical protein